MTDRKKKPSADNDKRADSGLSSRLENSGWIVWGLAGFLALGLIIYLRDFIFTAGTMIYGSDMAGQALQTRKLAVDAVTGGQGLPLWNPFSYCGLPYVGMLPGPIFFPTSLLYFVMPLYRAVGWSMLLMLLFGGLFAYLWITEIGYSRLAGAFAGLAWSFTGWIASGFSGGHDGRQFTMLLMPLTFFFLERGLKRRKPVYFALLGLAVALQILTPHMQMMYYSSLALSAWLAYRLWLLHGEGASTRLLAKLAGGYAAAFVLAVGLSAIQFVPFVVNMGFSQRQTGTGLVYEGYQHATEYSMHPLETLGLVVPGFTGEPDSYWAGADFKGHSEYMGLAVILFAVLALAYRRNRNTWFFVGLGLFGLLFNYGKFTPFFKLPFYLIPKIKDFRAPNQMFFVCGFSLLTLAAAGLDCLLGSRGDKTGEANNIRPVRLLGIAFGALAFFSLLLTGGRGVLIHVFDNMLPTEMAQARLPNLTRAYPQIVSAAWLSSLVAGVIWCMAWLYRKGMFGGLVLVAALMALTWGDLMRMDSHWVQVVRPEQVYYRDNIVKTLEKETEQYRVFFYPTPRSADYWDNSLLYFRIPTINASMPLRLTWYEELMGTFTMDNFVRYPRLWNMLNTRFVMIRMGTEMSKRFETALPLVVADSTTGRELFANPAAWPRFRLFSRLEVLPDDKQFVQHFNDQNFDFLNTLVLSDKPEFDQSRLDGATPEGDIKLERYEEGSLELTVTTTRPALVYLAETWHPYWRATLDGAPARIYRANLAMRAVFVEAGTHKLAMRYQSPSFDWGRRVSLLSIGLLAGLVIWTGYRKDW